MIWLTILLAFLVSFAAALGASFLSLAWRRRRKPSAEAARIELLLPGHDCGLCGHDSCRDFAAALDESGADPALCAPGGAELETALRELFSQRGGAEGRAQRRRAIVRCGASSGAAAVAFDYDNREDCATAASLYGGPLRCKEGCLGFGSCAEACPLGAIRVKGGLAVVDAALCSGCGACLDACPKGLIALVPADEPWYVACATAMDRELRRQRCSASCDACGECVRLSASGRFSIADGIARASKVDEAEGADIAPRCPSGAIRSLEPKKKADPPSGRSAPGL